MENRLVCLVLSPTNIGWFTVQMGIQAQKKVDFTNCNEGFYGLNGVYIYIYIINTYNLHVCNCNMQFTVFF